MRPKPAAGTEERLLDCALTLFAKRGYAATSVREIIEAVGLAKPVLYYYCKNKADLFRRLIRHTHDAAETELERQLAETRGTEEKLRAFIRGTFAFCLRDVRVPQLMFQTAYGPPVQEIAAILAKVSVRRFEVVRSIMAVGLAARDLAPADSTVLALAFCALVDHPANVLSRRRDAAAHLTPALADALLAVFLRGTARR